LTVSRAPHFWQWSPKNVAWLQVGQDTVSDCPQWEHSFHTSLIGERHLGHRSSSTGFHLPHAGQALESGGTSSSQ
jgi:hypothetical protein